MYGLESLQRGTGATSNAMLQRWHHSKNSRCCFGCETIIFVSARISSTDQFVRETLNENTYMNYNLYRDVKFHEICPKTRILVIFSAVKEIVEVHRVFSSAS